MLRDRNSAVMLSVDGCVAPTRGDVVARRDGKLNLSDKLGSQRRQNKKIEKSEERAMKAFYDGI